MAVHRRLLLGNGFSYNTGTRLYAPDNAATLDNIATGLARLTVDAVPEEAPGSLGNPRLPHVNFLRISEEHAQAHLQHIRAEDRARFRAYMSSCPLGLGVITAVGPLPTFLLPAAKDRSIGGSLLISHKTKGTGLWQDNGAGSSHAGDVQVSWPSLCHGADPRRDRQLRHEAL